jgi:HD superfamily phosphohydrolase
MIFNYNQDILENIYLENPSYFKETTQHPYFQRLIRISQTNDIFLKDNLEFGLNRFNHSVGTYLLTRDFL